VQNGCNINLDTWYIVFSALCAFKLLLQMLRYIHVRTQAKESIVFNLFGNYIIMPLIFAGFFIYTQGLFENATPDIEQPISALAAQFEKVEPNTCLQADELSKTLYGCF
jgi:hypothetical protein